MNNIVEIENPEYPQLLKEISDPPKKLYFKGTWDSSLFERCLAVAGSRRMTAYGKQITCKLVSEIAGAGITIVSGFMYGIDATAHQAAVEAWGKTIAVMPCGIDIIHPEYQESLHDRILESGGLIISEFERTFPPAVWTYPKRNRIMAGLSHAAMIVEAAEKSGSLITAGFAKEYGRRLFAVPGPLTSKHSVGTAQLIKGGADIVTGPKDILAEFNAAGHESFKNSSQHSNLSGEEKIIICILEKEPMEIDAVSRLAKISVSEAGSTISLMQLKGIVIEQEGKYYVN
ncbi:MAG: DNA-processing protein DprA [Candidatus Auribacterota bacterium]|nr:DNA-processing protein DprA [Candidatus Auribacterota bacterium]